MDDGGSYMEAQPGPINNELLEPEPLPWIDAAGVWCLVLSIYIGLITFTIVLLFVPLSDLNGVPIPRLEQRVIAFLLIFWVSLGVFVVSDMVHWWRQNREIETMTRLHMLPVFNR